MSEKQKEILTRLGEAMPKLSEADQAYVLGRVEALAEKQEASKDAQN